MNDQSNDALMARAAEVQSAIEDKYGKDVVGQMLGSIGRAGVPAAAIQQIVVGADAVEDFTNLGLEALGREMQAGVPSDAHVRACERAYTSIRDEQRRTRDVRKGRGIRWWWSSPAFSRKPTSVGTTARLMSGRCKCAGKRPPEPLRRSAVRRRTRSLRKMFSR